MRDRLDMRKRPFFEPVGTPTTNPELIRLQNENSRLRLQKALQQQANYEAFEIERLKRENDRLRKEVR
jgi:hypothetical protein